MNDTWSKESWRNFPILQQPEWPDKEKAREIFIILGKLPSLVFSGETRKLITSITSVNNSESFILQAGNCSESFSDCHGPKIHNYIRVMIQMAKILAFNTQKNIIKLGRIAGQYAKPRSSNYEIVDGKQIMVYRGDIINDFEPTENARTPNPNRLLEGYYRSAATSNLIRAFIQGGYTDIQNLSDWKRHFFVKEVSDLDYYKKFENDLTESFKSGKYEAVTNDNLFLSHEGLLLEYEEAFTRLDTTTTGFYSTTAHMLWIGDRTRQLNGAHIEYVRGIGNPIGIKIGPKHDTSEIVEIVKKINPANLKGRIILITRMGKEIWRLMPALVKAISRNKLNVTWMCDPMHGNTFTHGNYKVRAFDDIVTELKSFFSICYNGNVVPGGIHLEITGEYVTECIGGLTDLKLSDLNYNYDTKVDPRLNAAQALELSFIVSELLNQKK